MSIKLDYSKLTLMDALDLASLIELEAFKRYTQFAERLGRRFRRRCRVGIPVDGRQRGQAR